VIGSNNLGIRKRVVVVVVGCSTADASLFSFTEAMAINCYCFSSFNILFV